MRNMNITNDEYEYLAGLARRTQAAEYEAATLREQLAGAARVVTQLTKERDAALEKVKQYEMRYALRQ